ncbi:hypothetical protein J6590_100412 [Homalodisca vitripennis]|nr:hypothetical protein J6590_100412 [Homalodisca vitripennis]
MLQFRRFAPLKIQGADSAFTVTYAPRNVHCMRRGGGFDAVGESTFGMNSSQFLQILQEEVKVRNTTKID